MARTAAVVIVCGALTGCVRQQWPEPPPIDQAAYQQEYAQRRQGQQETAASAMKIVGIWPLQEGETSFGADPTLPIALPASSPARAGVFTKTGSAITVTPAAGVAVTQGDAGVIRGSALVESTLGLGSLRFAVVPMPPDRLFIMASDENHPAARTPPAIAAYPIGARWRVSARFDAFDRPRPVQVRDVRGGTTDFLALGQLAFKVDGVVHHLTAFGEPGGDELFVLFKDETNRSTTYGGFRIMTAKSAAKGEWTVLDFNLARNPPCAYSKFTTCPLPPPENRLGVAIEAGEKRHPTADGYAEG